MLIWFKILSHGGIFIFRNSNSMKMELILFNLTLLVSATEPLLRFV